MVKKAKLSVIGLGYVGLPLAIGFSAKLDVIGFDVDKDKIDGYINGRDPTKEVGESLLKSAPISFTTDESRLREATFHIITVPTPINQDKKPNLNHVIDASVMLGKQLQAGSIVVYESTVYPGLTEDICIPILEKESGLECGSGFFVGYSPERINPGDKLHRLDNIVKIVSATDDDTLDVIEKVYELVTTAGVYRAPSIKVAEAAKVAENSQRDINVAFMNELAMIFNRMGISTNEVIKAMNTKWNALGFTPGLVGGHCIGVDPYYFIYKAENLGYHSQVILTGRNINDSMGAYIADVAIMKMVHSEKAAKFAKVYIFGLTYKENCADTRNSKVLDIITRLKEIGISPSVVDPWVDPAFARKEFGVEVLEVKDVRDADCLIFAVAHSCFAQMGAEELASMFKSCAANERILIDIKGIFHENDSVKQGLNYWAL